MRFIRAIKLRIRHQNHRNQYSAYRENRRQLSLRISRQINPLTLEILGCQISYQISSYPLKISYFTFGGLKGCSLGIFMSIRNSPPS